MEGRRPGNALQTTWCASIDNQGGLPEEVIFKARQRVDGSLPGTRGVSIRLCAKTSPLHQPHPERLVAPSFRAVNGENSMIESDLA